MKTIEIIGWLVIIVAVYFNIGFFLKIYYRKNVFVNRALNTLARIAAGPWQIYHYDSVTGNEDELKSINDFWLILMFILIVAWFIWLVFDGGIVRMILSSIPSMRNRYSGEI